MDRLTDRELRSIYKECENIIDGVKEHYQNEKILECYNNLKEIENSYLSYTMLVDVYKKAIIEMADRFYNSSDLISRKAILNYLEKELNNLSQLKKEKPIPTEARVGGILTIKCIIQVIMNLDNII